MISYVTPIVEAKLPYWALLNYVNKGWIGIDDNIKSVIKTEDSESEASYAYRADKVTHFNNFTPILTGISGLVFSKPITLEANSKIEALRNNFDNKNNSMDSFIGTMFDKALIKGLAFCLVDMKRTEPLKNKAEQIKQNVRPYAVHIEPENVTAWRFDDDGLEMVKLREIIQIKDPDNIYATLDIIQYRVLYRGRWELWQEIEDKDTLIDEGITKLREIPFYCLNLQKTNVFEADFPFFDLAKLNIRHTQIFTDIGHSLHLANVPMLKFIGIDKEELEDFVIGANKAFITNNTDAKLDFLTLDTNAVTNSDAIMLKLEKQMLSIGLNVLSEDSRSSNITAKEAGIDARQKQSRINRWILEIEKTFNNILAGFGAYYGVEGGTIKIDADIASAPLDAQEVQAYTNLALNQGMSMETLFKMMKARKNIVTDNTWEDEKKLIDIDGLLEPKVEL